MYAMHLMRDSNIQDINALLSLLEAFFSAVVVDYKDKYPGTIAKDYRIIYQGDLHSYMPICTRARTYLEVR